MFKFDELFVDNTLLPRTYTNDGERDIRDGLEVKAYIKKLHNVLDSYVKYTKELNEVVVDILADSYHNKYQISPENYRKLCDLYSKFNEEVDGEQTKF